jgi:Protein of unknown function (DUF3618)
MTGTYENHGDGSNADPEAERIATEIESTRSEMGATIDEIGHRLQPQTIADEAREKIREATVGKVERMVDDAGQTAQRTGNTVVETVRQNPVPAALAAIGVGWLALKVRDQGQSSYGSGRSYGAGRAYRSPSRYGYRSSNGDESYTRSEQADPMDRASGTARDVAQRAQEVGADVQQIAQEAADGAQDRVREAQWQAQGLISDTQSQVDRTWNENPLALGALAVGVGAAIALAIPETQKEHELMGEQRDQLLGKVSSVASDALDGAQTKVQEVAEQIQSDSGTTSEGQSVNDASDQDRVELDYVESASDQSRI